MAKQSRTKEQVAKDGLPGSPLVQDEMGWMGSSASQRESEVELGGREKAVSRARRYLTGRRAHDTRRRCDVPGGGGLQCSSSGIPVLLQRCRPPRRGAGRAATTAPGVDASCTLPVPCLCPATVPCRCPRAPTVLPLKVGEVVAEPALLQPLTGCEQCPVALTRPRPASPTPALAMTHFLLSKTVLTGPLSPNLSNYLIMTIRSRI